MLEAISVLVLEGSVVTTSLIGRELQRGGFEPFLDRVDSRAAMQAALKLRHWDVVIGDACLPEFSGGEALAVMQEAGHDIPFIVIGSFPEDAPAPGPLLEAGHEFLAARDLRSLATAVRRALQTAQEMRIRKQADLTVAYLASIVDSCEDAVIGKKLDGTIVSWNSGAEKLYGYSSAEMIGRSITLLFPEYKPCEFQEIMRQIERGDHVKAFEAVRLRKDGTTVEVSVAISPIRDAGGRIIGASSVARDISARKEEEYERLALIQDLTAALTHARIQPERRS